MSVRAFRVTRDLGSSRTMNDAHAKQNIIRTNDELWACLIDVAVNHTFCGDGPLDDDTGMTCSLIAPQAPAEVPGDDSTEARATLHKARLVNTCIRRELAGEKRIAGRVTASFSKMGQHEPSLFYELRQRLAQCGPCAHSANMIVTCRTSVKSLSSKLGPDRITQNACRVCRNTRRPTSGSGNTVPAFAGVADPSSGPIQFPRLPELAIAHVMGNLERARE